MELVKVSVSFRPLTFVLAAIALLASVAAASWTVNRTIADITRRVDERIVGVQQVVDDGVADATAVLGQCEARINQVLGTLPANEQDLLDRFRGIVGQNPG